MKRLFGWLFLLGMGVLFFAFVTFRVVEAVERRSSAAERTQASGPPVVSTERATTRDLSGRVEVVGTLRSANTVDIGADVPGRVRERLVEVGDRVEAGASLARLDTTDLRLAVDQAEGALAAAVAAEDAAKREAQAIEQLAANKAVTDTQLVGVRAKLAAAVGQRQQAKAGRDLAVERLRDGTVKSPIAGVVTRAAVDVGQMLSPGVPAFQVQDDAVYEVDLGLDETSAYAVTVGLPASVRVVARGDLVLPGRVQTLSPSLDRQTRKAAATVRLDATTERLITGSTVMVALDLAPRSGVVTVPATAVVERADGSVVRVLGDGNAVRIVPVRTGIREEGRIEVDGVEPGAVVVVAGPAELPEGTVVEPRG